MTEPTLTIVIAGDTKSGKSRVAHAIAALLEPFGAHVYVIDMDGVPSRLGHGGFIPPLEGKVIMIQTMQTGLGTLAGIPS